MFKRLGFFTAVFMLTAVCAFAAPTQWATNGHWYEAVYTGGLDWTNSQAAAAALGGYLATITSEDENNFVFSLIDYPQYWFMDIGYNNVGPWIGGYYNGSPDTMNTTDWKWVSGESWVYAAWDDEEPNYPSERYAHYFSNDASQGNPIRQPFWNNVSDFPGIKGYIVEWNNAPSAVPEPATMMLLGSGLIGLLGLRRRFKK